MNSAGSARNIKFRSTSDMYGIDSVYHALRCGTLAGFAGGRFICNRGCATRPSASLWNAFSVRIRRFVGGLNDADEPVFIHRRAVAGVEPTVVKSACGQI